MCVSSLHLLFLLPVIIFISLQNPAAAPVNGKIVIWTPWYWVLAILFHTLWFLLYFLPDLSFQTPRTGSWGGSPAAWRYAWREVHGQRARLRRRHQLQVRTIAARWSAADDVTSRSCDWQRDITRLQAARSNKHIWRLWGASGSHRFIPHHASLSFLWKPTFNVESNKTVLKRR